MKKSKLLGLGLCCIFSLFAQPLQAVNIGANFRISNMGPDGNASYDGSFARIAYNSTDNQYLVVWSGDDDSLTDDEFEIWGQLLDVDGTAVGSAFRISDMGPNGNTSYGAFDPAVTYNSDANQYFVVWFGDDDTDDLIDNEFEVYGQLLDADGTEDVGGDIRLSDMGADGNTSYGALYPSVAYNSTDNEYLVVWQGDDNSGALVDNEYEAWGQLVNASGVEIGLDFRISDMGDDGSNLYVVDTPTVAYNDTDNQYMVVWSGDDNTAPLVNNELEIFGRLIDANGVVDVGGDLRLSSVGDNGNTSYSAIAPQIAYNSADNQYLVVWYGDNNTGSLVDDEYEVWGQLVDADGVEDGIDFRVSSMGTDGDANSDAGNTSVSYNSASNLYLVAWRGDDGSAPLIDNEIEIWGQLVNADGSEEGEDERISDMGSDGNTAYMALAPAIAFNSTDNGFLVVWHGDDNSGSLVDNELEIWGQLFNNPIDCALGYYSVTGDDSGVRGSCTICEAGSYQAFTGQTECIPCPAGYFQENLGSIVCFECGPGTVQPDTGQADCNDCPAGEYQAEPAQSTCDVCGAGTFNPDVAATECFDCGYGTVQSDVGQSSCDSCPAGYHQDELGQTECEACAAGQFNAAEGEAFCDNCLPGSYTDETAQIACILCAADTFAADAGAVTCEACAAGFTSAEGALECSEVVDDSGDDSSDDTSDDTTPAAASAGCQLVI